MTVKNTRAYRTFGRWLAHQRKSLKLTQAEAVKKMRDLSPTGKGVSVGTWSRWEKGYRPPSRSKIDLVAQVIKISPKDVRRRAGLEAPERAIRRDRNDIIASMLRVLSSDMSIDARVLNLYSLGTSHRDKTDAAANRKLIMEIAHTFESLKDASEQVQIATIGRIRQICREAKGVPQFTVPPDRATMIIPKRGFPPVMLGTRIEVEYRDAEGYMVSDLYVVRRIKYRKNKLLARIVCVEHADFPSGTSAETAG
jgi:transcriptional regulator with XRE-family HTH domain